MKSYKRRLVGEANTPVDLSISEAKAVLRSSPIRVVRDPSGDFTLRDGFQNMSVQIKYRGRWVDLCRTDLLDDVCTGECLWKRGKEQSWESIESIRRCYIRKVQFGARIKKNSFAVVDSCTDG